MMLVCFGINQSVQNVRRYRLTKTISLPHIPMCDNQPLRKRTHTVSHTHTRTHAHTHTHAKTHKTYTLPHAHTGVTHPYRSEHSQGGSTRHPRGRRRAPPHRLPRSPWPSVPLSLLAHPQATQRSTVRVCVHTHAHVRTYIHTHGSVRYEERAGGKARGCCWQYKRRVQGETEKLGQAIGAGRQGEFVFWAILCGLQFSQRGTTGAPVGHTKWHLRSVPFPTALRHVRRDLQRDRRHDASNWCKKSSSTKSASHLVSLGFYNGVRSASRGVVNP